MHRHEITRTLTSGDIVQKALPGTLPLSVAQRGLWVASKLAPASIVFTIAEAIEIHGSVDEACFLDALDRLANEIEPSRTRIVEDASGPRQLIGDHFEGECPRLDLSTGAAPFESAMRWMNAELSRPVDFRRDPLWKSALIRLGEAHFLWYHRCHHVVMDGFSGGLIANRLASLYNALLAGAPPPPSPFGKIATLLDMEAAYRSSERHARDRAYWLDHLADLPEPVSLARRRRAGTGPLRRHTARLDPALSARLTTLARELGGTLPQILIALVAIYVHRVTAASDLTLGMPVTGRVGHAMRAIPAMVANAVVMRFRFAPDMGLADIVAQSARNMRSALRHQQYRYEDLRRALGLFHTDQQVSWTGVNIEPFDFDLSFGGHRTTAHNLSNGPVEDLTIFVYDRNDDRGLRIDFDANALLYEAQELERHADRLLRMIGDVADHPETPLDMLNLLATGERERLLGIRGPTSDIPLDPVAMLDGPLPDKVAVRDRTRSLTYPELHARALTVAGALTRAGVGPGHVVALAPQRDAGMLAVLVGTLVSGAAFLPVDPDGPAERTAVILADAKPCMMLANADTAVRFGFTDPVEPGIGLHAQPGAQPAPTTPPDTAYVIYTSGSTGTPKGVMVPRRALANLLAGIDAELGLTERDRLLAVTTLGFDIAILELLLPIARRGEVVVASRAQVTDPRALTRFAREAGITIIQATPSLWSTILAAGDTEALRGLTLLSGGEALPGHLARRLHGLGARLFNLYGPTETTIWSTIQRVLEPDLDHPSIGRPLPNQHVYVLDPRGALAPIGVVGELCIGGDGVATGYVGKRALTQERFAADPFSTQPGARIYRTGDRASIRPDGLIDYFGRGDDQIKVRGVRLEPAETEAALMQIDGIGGAAVVLRHDGGEPRLCGYLVTRPGQAPAVEEIRRMLSRKLPDAAIPTAWAMLDRFPLNANGKLDRRALPAPELASRAGYLPPRTEDEQLLAAIWEDLFGLDRVGLRDNFFALGGDSLIAAQLIAELSARGAELPLGAMFEDATLESLAAELGRSREGVGRQAHSLAPVLTIRSHGDAAPLFCIHPVSGLAWGYAGLIRHVAARPIYGLQSFGAPADDAAGSLSGLAAAYLDLIRSLQPHGPYHILGFSFGGLVAHEIARQVEASHGSVAFLGLLDAYPYRPNATFDVIGSAAEGELVHAALDFLGLDAHALGDRPRMDHLIDHLTDVYDITHRPLPSEVGSPAQLVAQLRAVTEANLKLACRHTPGTVSADVLFVRATERTGSAQTFIDDRPDAWAPYVRGLIERVDVSCSHQDMLDPAALDIFAPLIGRRLAHVARQPAQVQNA